MKRTIENMLSVLRHEVSGVRYPFIFSKQNYSARRYQDADFFSEYFWFREGLKDGLNGDPFESIMRRPLREFAYLKGIKIGRMAREIRLLCEAKP